MPTWNISIHSNAKDKTIGYEQALREVRDYVRTSGTPNPTNVNIVQISQNPQVTTSLQMQNTNFQVVSINNQVITYNYANPLPVFLATDIMQSFPVGAVAASAAQKTKLLYMFPEAARSSVIESAIKTVIAGSDVDLNVLSPLVNAYGHTANLAQVNVNHPQRPLTALDYRNYAATLPVGTPDRQRIIDAVTQFG
ncbi:hypothetical protein [Methylobacterium indicum]|uniref:hypothetical protein n=1 Tax=Methylobacterium indicum TaxID=1775910 RepID=UPI000B1585EF|nr:hypothetical protein [Methylobacterium indicum]